MKQYHEPIQVEVGDDGLPYSFRWRNRAWNVISVMDRWVLQTGWRSTQGVAVAADQLASNCRPLSPAPLFCSLSISHRVFSSGSSVGLSKLIR